MSVGCRLFINRAAQVEHTDDARGTEIEILTDNIHQLFIGNLSGAVCIHHDGGRTGHTDGIGKLNLTLVGKAGGNDVLRRIAGRIGRGAVHLGAVLTGESAAAVTGIAAIGINDDLASCQTAVAVRAADDEAPGGVDEIFGGTHTF